MLRPHAKCLPDRRFVYRPNEGPSSNAPVGIGYGSTVGISARWPLYGLSAAPWNLPLSMRLVLGDQNRNSFIAAQVNQLLDHPDLPIGKELTINALDSNYAAPEYLADTHDQGHLVNIVRLASTRFSIVTDPRFQQRKAQQLPPSPSVVQQQLAGIIVGFEQEPFRPKGQIKGKGRVKGTPTRSRKRAKSARKPSHDPHLVHHFLQIPPRDGDGT